MSFIFGGQTGETAASLKRRRHMADALLQQAMHGKARDVPSAIGAVGNALVGRYAQKKNDKEIANRQNEASSIFRDAVLGQTPSFNPFVQKGDEFDTGSPHSTPINPQQRIDNAFGAPEDIQSIISTAASNNGVDPATLTRIAKLESNFDPNAQNPNSSAGGLFQFIDSTAGDFGLQNRFDPNQASDAAARLAAQNTNSLKSALGREVTPGEIYLAHQQGAGGAAKLLANPNARAIDVVGEQQVKLNGGNANMTAGEFASLWTSKFDDLNQQPNVQVAQQTINPQLVDALSNPFLNPHQREILAGLLHQQMAPPAAPKPTDDIKEYQFALRQGFNGSFQDWLTAQRKAGATSVNVTNQGNRYGTIPAGHQLIDGPEGVSMVPIPGSPAAIEAEKLKQKAANSEKSKANQANFVLDEIDIARHLIDNSDAPTTGIAGGILANIDSTDAGRLKNRLTTIKSNIGFDKLQDMRDNSPTGGALGQVSEFENRLLQAVFGSLEQSQTKDDLLYNLQRLQDLYGRVIHEGISDDEARQLYRDNVLGKRPTAQGADAPPEGVEPEIWEQLTPEEKSLWQN